MSQQALLALPLQGWSLSQHGERHSHHNFHWEDCGSLGWGKPMIKCWAWIEKVTSITAENGVQETIYQALECTFLVLLHTLQSRSGFICEISCGVTAPFSWALVHTKFCLWPPSVCFPSSGSSMVRLMVISIKRAYAISKSAAPRAPVPAAGHCWPVTP